MQIELSHEECIGAAKFLLAEVGNGVESKDDERAHMAEKKLWEKVLFMISNSDEPKAAALAKVALESQKFGFSRWFA